MPITTPAIISPEVYPILTPDDDNEIQRVGPFQGSNGNWYVIFPQKQVGGSTINISAYKSIDQGVTTPWTPAAIGPSNVSNRSFVINSFYPGTGDIIYIAYLKFSIVAAQNVADFFVVPFDMSTETFGTVLDPGIRLNYSDGTGDNITFLIAVNGTGGIVLAWDSATATTIDIFVDVYASAAWSGAIKINGAVVRAGLDMLQVDGDGNVGILWSSWLAQAGFGTAFGTRQSIFYTILNGITPGSPVTAMANACKVKSRSFSDSNIMPGIYDPASDSIVFPIIQQTLSGGNCATGTSGNVLNTEMDVLVGTPASNPTFTTITVAGPGSGANVPLGSTDVVGPPRLSLGGTTGGTMSAVFGNNTFVPGSHPPLPYLLTTTVTASSFQMVWASELTVGGNPTQYSLQMSVASILSVWGAESTFYDYNADPPPDSHDGRMFFLWLNLIAAAAPTPTPTPGKSGGRGFIKFKLNPFDICLGRDYRLYEKIDRTILSCGVKPACFLTDERQWGTSNDDDEIIPGAPGGSIAFNPSGQLILPSTVSGDNVIFQFSVPVGYDGILLGQFHQYYQDPVGGLTPPPFIEGSGDIVWRISATGRFVKDCGAMVVSLGSYRSQSPIAGGIQLRSQDLVQYIVNVPNVTGGLSPGQGQIAAGVHGYFWPMK